MGMFDELTCKYPLPDSQMQNETFQTKSFDRTLTHYTITEDGRLIEHLRQWDAQAKRMRHEADVEIPYHGDIRCYTFTGSHDDDTFEWFEYVARFTEGRLQWIKRIDAQST